MGLEPLKGHLISEQGISSGLLSVAWKLFFVSLRKGRVLRSGKIIKAHSGPSGWVLRVSWLIPVQKMDAFC